MTIHKAKGLEFPVVIYPYSIDIYNQINPRVWYSYQETGSINSVLVNARKKLNFTGKQGGQLFKQQREELELDNFNLLYVALTRPIEQLYIVSENNISSKNEENLSHTSGLFINFLKELNLWNADKEEYSFGDKERIAIPKKEVNKTVSQTSFITNSWKNHNISIVAKSSLLWDTNQGKAIVYGNLIHEILSKIKTKNDISEVVNQYTYKGTITTIQKNEIIAILNELVNHPKLSDYFEQNRIVYTEQEIVTSEKNIIIPDRLVINNNNVTIIDYKTGNPDIKYHNNLTNMPKH